MDESEVKQRRIPYFAKAILNQTAEDAHAIVMALDPLMEDRHITPEQLLRALAKATSKARDIRGRLAREGAQIVF